MGVLKVKITTGTSGTNLKNNFQSNGDKHSTCNKIAQFLTSAHTGGQSAQGTGQPPSINIVVQDNEVQAKATVTFTGVGAIGDTIIINGVTFTGAVAAAANVYAIGASATTSAAGLAAAINASVTAFVSGYVTATSALGVCTVTSAFYGLAGNQTTIAEGVDSGAVMTVSSAKLITGAADPSALTLNF